MKVFISWSGDTSRQIATAFADFIGTLLQHVRPFVSATDIGKGVRWFERVSLELRDTNFGVVILTPENLHSPWIMFEAGALSKQLDQGRVSCLVFEMSKADVELPLGGFQNTDFNDDDVWKLVESINACGETHVAKERLAAIYKELWDRFANNVSIVFAKARESSGVVPDPHPRSQESKIDELLNIVREIASKQAQGRFGGKGLNLGTAVGGAQAGGGHATLGISEAVASTLGRTDLSAALLKGADDTESH